MTTTTADRGELLPCPFCGGPVELEQTIDHRKWWGVVCRNTYNVGGTCAVQQRPSASREAAIARWNRRPTNEGQDGLTEDEVWQIAEQTLNSRTIKASTGYDIHFFARAIARHLSSKQTDHIGDATQMVKADAVKMPETIYVAFADNGNIRFWTADEAQAHAFMQDTGIYCAEFSAHTAEAVRELVDGLRHAADWINSEPHGDNCFLGDELSGNRCWCGKDSFVEATDALLAKYAPSQEVKDGG